MSALDPMTPAQDNRSTLRKLWDGLVGNPSPLKRQIRAYIHEHTSRMEKPPQGTPEPAQPEVRHRRQWLPRVGMIFVIAAMCALAGCSLQAQYVEADRLTFEAIAQDYLKLIEASDRSEAEKEMARLTVESWSLRLAEAAKDTAK